MSNPAAGDENSSPSPAEDTQRDALERGTPRPKPRPARPPRPTEPQPWLPPRGRRGKPKPGTW